MLVEYIYLTATREIYFLSHDLVVHVEVVVVDVVVVVFVVVTVVATVVAVVVIVVIKKFH